MIQLGETLIKQVDINCTTDQSLIGISNTNKNIWRWCRHCVKEEEKLIGVAYWHQLHQQPCVVACIKHEAPLLELNIPYRDRQSRFLLPKDVQDKRFRQSVNKRYLNSAIAIANIQKRLLQDHDKLELLVVEDLMKSNHGSDSSVELHRHAIKSITCGKKQFEAYLNNRISTEAINWTYLPLRIFSCFGEYDFFWHRYRWHHIMNRGITIKQDSTYVELQTLHRKACTELINKNLICSRIDYWKRNPQSMRWLTKYDKPWLDKLLPCENRVSTKGNFSQLNLI